MATDLDATPGSLRPGAEARTARADDRDLEAQLDALFDGRGPVPPELRDLVGLDPESILWRETDGADPAGPGALEVATAADLGEPLEDVAARCGDLDADPAAAAEAATPEAAVSRRLRQLPSWIPGLVVGALVGIAVMAALFPPDTARNVPAGERLSAVTIPHSWEQAHAPVAEEPLRAGMRRAQVVAQRPATNTGVESRATEGQSVAYQAPIAVLRVLPEYAPADLSVGQSETVVLRVLVDDQGHAARVLIESGTPGSPLVAAAVDAVVQSHYRPATESGLQVAAWTTESFVFER